MKKYIIVFLLSFLLLPAFTYADTYKCLDFNSGLHLGSRDFVKNGDVSRLQDFLINQGFLKSNITGYFGSQTYRAVRDFQRSFGFSAVGNVGPMTRNKIKNITCNLVVNTTPSIFSMTPTTGIIGTNVTLYGKGFTRENTINFGNGVIPNVVSIDNKYITFTVPGSLVPPCVYANPACYMTAMPNMQTPPGTYPVSVTNQNGVTSNTIDFTVVAQQNTVSPVISGVDSPTNLTVGQSGTWTVRASDPEGKGLSYSVLWGDESTVYPAAMSAQRSSFIQTSTFTHAYNNPGVYTVTFVVRGQNGQTSQISTTVQVTGTNSKPQITSVYPSEIKSFRTTVTIYGTGFTRYTNSINFNGVTNVDINVPSYDGTSLQFTVPATPCSQLDRMCAQVILGDGVYPITVTNENGTSNSAQITVNTSSSSINKVVTVGLGSTAYINNNMDIRPIEVIEDSRCPIGVYCIQAGRVVVKTQIRSYDALQILNIASDQPVVAVDGYRISITDVQPIRRAGFNINQSDYMITYQISR
jgi:peptidoglycan hydrolase-like protein with peptidoglycan-binding domain